MWREQCIRRCVPANRRRRTGRGCGNCGPGQAQSRSLGFAHISAKAHANRGLLDIGDSIFSRRTMAGDTTHPSSHLPAGLALCRRSFASTHTTRRTALSPAATPQNHLCTTSTAPTAHPEQPQLQQSAQHLASTPFAALSLCSISTPHHSPISRRPCVSPPTPPSRPLRPASCIAPSDVGPAAQAPRRRSPVPETSATVLLHPHAGLTVPSVAPPCCRAAA